MIVESSKTQAINAGCPPFGEGSLAPDLTELTAGQARLLPHTGRPHTERGVGLKQRTKYRADLFVLAGIVLAGLLLGLGLLLFGRQGAQVQVRVAGEVVSVWPLSQDGSYTIQGVDGGTNVLVIEAGSARIVEASCPDGLCVGMGSISKSGQSIVCLPNQVVVEIISDGTDDDASDVDLVAE